jgi:phosphatidate phosphatase APP1
MDGWDDLSEFAEELVEDMVVDVKNVAVESFMKNITQPISSYGEDGVTPVLEGKLMANTVVSIGKPDTRVRNETDEEGYTTYWKGVETGREAKAWQKIYIQNNAESEGRYYAANADYLGWKYTPAYHFFTDSYFVMTTTVEDYK